MVRVSNSLLVALSLTLLGPLSVSAQGIEARFSTEKTNYLVGEPLFVILTVSNKTSETSWLEFQSPDLAKLLCDDFAVEVTAAEPAEEPWGRSEEHTSELQSHSDLVCRLLLEKKKKKIKKTRQKSDKIQHPKN